MLYFVVIVIIHFDAKNMRCAQEIFKGKKKISISLIEIENPTKFLHFGGAKPHLEYTAFAFIIAKGVQRKIYDF